MTAHPTRRERRRAIVETVRRVDLALLAAAIAFYSLLSIVPLTVIVVALGSSVAGEPLLDRWFGAIDHLVTEDTIQSIRTGLAADLGRSGATAIGILVAAWGSLRGFRALDRAFDVIYGAPQRAGLYTTVRNAVAVLVATLGIAGGVGVAVIGLYALGGTVPAIILPVAVIPVLAVVLAPMYAVFPPTDTSVRAVLPGTLVGAGGIALATVGLQAYIAIAAPFAVYGLLAGIVVILTWLYLAAGAILLGAVVNATGERHRQVHWDAVSQPGPNGPMAEEDDELTDDRSDDDLATLRSRLEDLEMEVEERTVHRDEIERELRSYVRRRQRRGHARGWGPYLVLLYGVIMTLGAFYYLDGWVAILAMIVVWLSTLGLYVFMVVMGLSIGILATLKGALRRVRGGD